MEKPPEDINTDQKIYKFMKICDKNNDPIPLNYEDDNIGKITFGYLTLR